MPRCFDIAASLLDALFRCFKRQCDMILYKIDAITRFIVVRHRPLTEERLRLLLSLMLCYVTFTFFFFLLMIITPDTPLLMPTKRVADCYAARCRAMLYAAAFVDFRALRRFLRAFIAIYAARC